MGELVLLPFRGKRYEDFKYVVHETRIIDKEGKDYRVYPCIVLKYVPLDIIVSFTKYEIFLRDVTSGSWETDSNVLIRAKAACSFLNYMLHETKKHKLNELNEDDITG